jgi:hypothetical protein
MSSRTHNFKSSQLYKMGRNKNNKKRVLDIWINETIHELPKNYKSIEDKYKPSMKYVSNERRSLPFK